MLQQNDWIVNSSENGPREKGPVLSYQTKLMLKLAGGSRTNVQRVCQRHQGKHLWVERIIHTAGYSSVVCQGNPKLEWDQQHGKHFGKAAQGCYSFTIKHLNYSVQILWSSIVVWLLPEPASRTPILLLSLVQARAGKPRRSLLTRTVVLTESSAQRLTQDHGVTESKTNWAVLMTMLKTGAEQERAELTTEWQVSGVNARHRV